MHSNAEPEHPGNYTNLVDSLMESVREEEQAIELMLDAVDAGDTKRVEELAQHIRSLRQRQ